MPTRKKPAVESVALQRREQVQAYWLRGVKPRNIAQTLKVDRKTVYKDLQAIQDQLSRRVEAAQLYSLQRCFAELDEEWKEAWILYHRPPAKEVTRKGEVVTLDDRGIKMMLLARIHDVIMARARLSGFMSDEVIQRLTTVTQTVNVSLTMEHVKKLPEEEQIVLARTIRDIESQTGSSAS